jgi:hypothetical protein
MDLEKKDIIAFRRRKTTKLLESTLQPLKIKTLERAKEMTIKASTGWDFYAIEQEFIELNRDRTDIKNIDGLFIGFVKNKVAKCP